MRMKKLGILFFVIILIIPSGCRVERIVERTELPAPVSTEKTITETEKVIPENEDINRTVIISEQSPPEEFEEPLSEDEELPSDQKEPLSIEEIRSQIEEIKVSLGKREYVLFKVNPELVQHWYQHFTLIDDREWTLDPDGKNSYVCIHFAFDSAEQWRKDFQNPGLYLAASRSAFHRFNAVYLGGPPLVLESWAFLEPQQGGRIIGKEYINLFFPFEVTLEYEGVFRKDRFIGINPKLKIIWENNSTTGTLFKVSRSGNLIPEGI